MTTRYLTRAMPPGEAFPCCVCGTKGGFIKPGRTRPMRNQVDVYGGPSGVACNTCYLRTKRGYRARFPELSAKERSKLDRRAWKRARASRLLHLADVMRLPWRAVRQFVDFTETNRMRKAMQ